MIISVSLYFYIYIYIRGIVVVVHKVKALFFHIPLNSQGHVRTGFLSIPHTVISWIQTQDRGPRWHTCLPPLRSAFKTPNLMGRVGSCLPMVCSLQYRTLTNCICSLVSSAHKTTHRDMTYTMLKGCKTTNK